jgi:sulfide:quinone oxidoreductase
MEAALALADLAGDRARLSLVAPSRDFVNRPLTVEEPFTQKPADRRALEPALAELGIEYIHGAVRAINPDSHTVALRARDEELAYDFLVVCIGARFRDAYEGVETFWSDRSDLSVDALIRRAHSALRRTLVLIVPPGTSWSLPLYEVALMIRRRTEELDLADLRLGILTPEPAPLDVFGAEVSGAIARLLAARHISVTTDLRIVQSPAGTLHLAPQGTPVEAGVVVTAPVIEGPSIPGVPDDPHGFIQVDEHGRVEGLSDVYAAGDGTTFPIKQGGVATQQADAVAEHIAARLGASVEPKPFTPVLRGQLLTGSEPLYLTHGLAGDDEGAASLNALWWSPQKVSGRYLTPWLERVDPTVDPQAAETRRSNSRT